MHVPDGILSMPVMVATNSIAITILGLAWNRIRHVLTQNTFPKVALLAAFLFVAQMINIPVLGRTSAPSGRCNPGCSSGWTCYGNFCVTCYFDRPDACFSGRGFIRLGSECAQYWDFTGSDKLYFPFIIL